MDSHSKYCNFLIVVAIIFLTLALVQSQSADDNNAVVVAGGPFGTTGCVYGIRSCGGQGQLVQWRTEDCKTIDSPCQIPADGKYHTGEFTIIPRESSEQLGIREFVSINGSDYQPAFDHVIKNSAVRGGTTVTIIESNPLPEALKGSMVSSQVIFYRVSDGKTEVCVGADFLLV